MSTCSDTSTHSTCDSKWKNTKKRAKIIKEKSKIKKCPFDICKIKLYIEHIEQQASVNSNTFEKS